MEAYSFNALCPLKGHTYLNKPAAESMCDLFMETTCLRIEFLALVRSSLNRIF